eukprot:Em0008g834a
MCQHYKTIENADHRKMVLEDFDPQKTVLEDFDPQKMVLEDFDPQKMVLEDFDPQKMVLEDFDPQKMVLDDFDPQKMVLESYYSHLMVEGTSANSALEPDKDRVQDGVVGWLQGCLCKSWMIDPLVRMLVSSDARCDCRLKDIFDLFLQRQMEQVHRQHKMRTPPLTVPPLIASTSGEVGPMVAYSTASEVRPRVAHDTAFESMHVVHKIKGSGWFQLEPTQFSGRTSYCAKKGVQIGNQYKSSDDTGLRLDLGIGGESGCVVRCPRVIDTDAPPHLIVLKQSLSLQHLGKRNYI